MVNLLPKTAEMPFFRSQVKIALRQVTINLEFIDQVANQVDGLQTEAP